MRIARLWTLCAGFAVAGCGHEGQTEATRWSLAPTAFEIGGLTDDERYSLSEVMGATRLSDGRVVIVDHFAQGLRVFSPSGEYLASVGGKGEGPGEYEYVRGMGPCAGDSVVVFDLYWDEKIYDENLQLLEERSPVIPGLEGSAYDFACEPSGYVVATGWGDFEDQFRAGYHVATAPVVLVRQGKLVYDFGERLSSERVGSVRPSGEPAGSSPHPFGRKTTVAIGGGRVYLGDAAEYSVEVYDFAGDPLPSITWSGPARDISDRHIALYEDAQVSEASESQRPAVRRRIRDMPRLERFPAYDRLRVDAAGNLWVRHFPKPGATEAKWVVFDGGGAMVGRLLVPMSTTLLELGADYAIVVETDELDVETVRVMQLLR